MQLRLIIGLGNPGEKYKMNRHNIGWLILDRLIEELEKNKGTGFSGKAFKYSKTLESSDLGEQDVDNTVHRRKLLLVYPQTFMNNSGQAVSELLQFYKLSAKDILVIHDEIDLPLGNFKFTESSGSAGHNGVKSIIEVLGTQDFQRIRVGIESRENKSDLPTDAFVLQNFSADELKKIPFTEILKKIL